MSLYLDKKWPHPHWIQGQPVHKIHNFQHCRFDLPERLDWQHILYKSSHSTIWKTQKHIFIISTVNMS